MRSVTTACPIQALLRQGLHSALYYITTELQNGVLDVFTFLEPNSVSRTDLVKVSLQVISRVSSVNGEYLRIVWTIRSMSILRRFWRSRLKCPKSKIAREKVHFKPP